MVNVCITARVESHDGRGRPLLFKKSIFSYVPQSLCLNEMNHHFHILRVNTNGVLYVLYLVT